MCVYEAFNRGSSLKLTELHSREHLDRLTPTLCFSNSTPRTFTLSRRSYLKTHPPNMLASTASCSNPDERSRWHMLPLPTTCLPCCRRKSIYNAIKPQRVRPMPWMNECGQYGNIFEKPASKGSIPDILEMPRTILAGSARRVSDLSNL